MAEERADTVPGFTMQSENFYLKFITGLQCGVSSRLLEYETDWYEVMEIILSRLQDEQENKEGFEAIASRDLEYWAKMQPGGDSLNLQIRCLLEEKRYFEPPAGSRKALRLVFNDRFSTQVLFHVRKKMFLKSLRELSAVAVADLVAKEETFKSLGSELPLHLIPEVRRAFNDCWTPRFFRTKLVRYPCPPSCSCKSRIYTSYVAQLISRSNLSNPLPQPQPHQPVAAEPQPEPLALPPPVEEIAPLQPSPSEPLKSSKASKQAPRKSIRRKSRRTRAKSKRLSKEDKSKDCENCSNKSRVSTRSSCSQKSIKQSSQESSKQGRQNKYLKGLRVKIRQIHFEFESLVMKVRGKKRKAEEKVESPRRKSSRLVILKDSLRDLSKSRKSLPTKEDIFEPRSLRNSFKKAKLSLSRHPKAQVNSPSDKRAVKRTLRSNVLDASSARKRRRHS